ncbi:MAG: hypothetical protein JSV98_10890 [candidate division WOR-3 bacterium]|nr:MAG: hypothetical protein JSV98_10890 [candidate division WOR-3 bacterium]
MSSKKAMTIGALVAVCMVGGCASTAVKKSTHSDSIKAHSVWQGTCDQRGVKPYPMILFIKNRKGDAFEGMTWYPTLNNGLITISGQIRPEGIVTFTEDEVIYGGPNEYRPGVISGGQFTATIEGNNLKGGYEITPPGTGNVEKGNILLKLAD